MQVRNCQGLLVLQVGKERSRNKEVDEIGLELGFLYTVCNVMIFLSENVRA